MSGRQAVWTCLHLRVVLKRAIAHGEGTNIPLCGIENSYQFGNKHMSAHTGGSRTYESGHGCFAAIVSEKLQTWINGSFFCPCPWDNILNKPNSQQASLQALQGTAAPPSLRHGSPRWLAAKILMMQSNKSTRPALY